MSLRNVNRYGFDLRLLYYIFYQYFTRLALSIGFTSHLKSAEQPVGTRSGIQYHHGKIAYRSSTGKGQPLKRSPLSIFLVMN